MKDNKLQPKLRFKEFNGDWKEKKLDSLMIFKNGINATKEQYGKGKKFINVLDILTEKPIIYNSIRGLVDVSEEIFSKNTVSYGDVVFQRSSETREEVGTANVYLDKDKDSTFGGFVIRGKKIGEYHPIFMNKLLKTSSARNIITSKSGGSTRYNLSQSTLNEVLLKFPNLEEQEKIANFLSSVDNKIEKLEKKKSLLEQYKKGVMQKIFNQEIRFKDENENSYPNWEEKKLGEITSFNQGYQIPSSKQKKVKLENYYRYLYISDFFSDRNITYVNFDKKMKLLNEGDIVIANTGNTAGSFYKSKTGILSNNMFSIEKSNYYRNDFLYVFLSSDVYLKQLNKFFNSGGQPHLGHKNMSLILMPLPCLEEQEKIAKFLSSIDSKIEITTNNIEKNKEFKKGLLQQMFC